MKSSIVKRSVVLNGHKTSVSLEDEFWFAIREIAAQRNQAVAHLIASIDVERHHANLSSAIRLFVLEQYREGFVGWASTNEFRVNSEIVSNLRQGM